MDAKLSFNIWLLTSVTEDDKKWLNENLNAYGIERTGILQYRGEECLMMRPSERYLPFILLKFGERMRPFPLEQYMANNIVALQSVNNSI